MNTQQDSTKDQDKKQQSRSKLVALLAKLRSDCETFETVDQWMDMAQQFAPLFEPQWSALPLVEQQRLKKALDLAEATRSGISQGCKVLKFEIEGVLNRYPWTPTLNPIPKPDPTPIIPTWAAGVLILAAGVVLVVVVIGSVTAVPLAITNQNCERIQLNSITLPIPGLKLPDSVEKGKTETATLPAAVHSIEVGGRVNGQIVLTAMGQASVIQMPSNVKSVQVDNVSVLGRDTTINIDPSSQHSIVISCQSA